MVVKADRSSSHGLVGQSLSNGRYYVTAKLAEGGMGYVYRALDHHLGNDVVIKIPRKEMIGLSVDRFSQEIRSLVQYAHPHILHILDVGEYEGLPFAVMQYLAGGTLEDRLGSSQSGLRALPVASLRDWLRPIALALDFIHSQRYVHRDVKPANILFDTHGNAFLSDFGVGKVISSIAEQQMGDAMTASGAIVGTPQYMAPELSSGSSFDGRADQYALAVCVYETLSGRRPYEGNNVVVIHIQQMGDGPVPLLTLCRDLPVPIAEAVHKGLSYLPEQRFNSCVEFADAILSCIESPNSVSGSAWAEQGRQIPCIAASYVSELSVDEIVRTVRAQVEKWNVELLRFERTEIAFQSKIAGNWFGRLLKRPQVLTVKLQLDASDPTAARLALTLYWPEDDLLQQEFQSQAGQLLSQLIVKLCLTPIDDTKVELSQADTNASTDVVELPSKDNSSEDDITTTRVVDLVDLVRADEPPFSPFDLPCQQLLEQISFGHLCMLIDEVTGNILGQFGDTNWTVELRSELVEYVLQFRRLCSEQPKAVTRIHVQLGSLNLHGQYFAREKRWLLGVTAESTTVDEFTAAAMLLAKEFRAPLPTGTNSSLNA